MSQSFPIASNNDGTWSSLSRTFRVCNRKYKFAFDKNGDGGQGSATLTRATGISGGDDGTVFPLVRGGCGCNWIEFAVGDQLVCTGPEACGGGCANLAKIRVQQVPCNYTGEGWYCVEECGAEVSEVLHLVESDLLSDFGIISGPYATEADALASCGPVALSCHAAVDDPAPVTRTFQRGPKCVTFGGTLSFLGRVSLVHNPFLPLQPLAWAAGLGDVTGPPINGTTVVTLTVVSGYPQCHFLLRVTIGAEGETACDYQWVFAPRTDTPFAFDSAVDTVDSFTPDVGIFCPVVPGTITFAVSEGNC